MYCQVFFYAQILCLLLTPYVYLQRKRSLHYP